MANSSRSATRQAWVQRINRFETSGKTIAQFCLGENVSTASFYYWRRKLRDETTPAGFRSVNLPSLSPQPQPTAQPKFTQQHRQGAPAGNQHRDVR